MLEVRSRWFKLVSLALIVLFLGMLVVAGAATNVSADKGWTRNPTDAEIQQAAQEFIAEQERTVAEVWDWKTVKAHKLGNVRHYTAFEDPLVGNVVVLAYRVVNPDYDASNRWDNPLRFSMAVLVREKGCWYFTEPWALGSWFEESWKETSLDKEIGEYIFAGDFWRRHKDYHVERGWIGGPPPEENQPPTVTLTYSPENPTPGDTVEFTTTAYDPET